MAVESSPDFYRRRTAQEARSESELAVLFRGTSHGSKSSPRNYWLFPGATTMRSTLSPGAWNGAASDGANFRRDSSKVLRVMALR